MLYLPFISVQADWHEVAQEVALGTSAESTFWIACYITGKPSIQGSVFVKKSKEGFELEGREGFVVSLIDEHSFRVEYNEIKNIIVQAPKTIIPLSEKRSISCVDVSPNAMLFATVDGSNILVGSFADGKSQKTLTGHLDDVNTVQFFPSNLVLLSGGADFQLKIWSVIDGSNPVTLKGHTSGITSTAIIDKGRNILSSSRDGKAYLWNCGNGSILSTLGNYSAAINKMILTQLPPTYQPAPVDTLLPNEIGTEDKMVLVALGDGSVQGLHLGTKAKLFASEPTGIALTAIAYDEISSLLFTGNEQGQICIYALTRGLKEPIATWQRNQSPVTSLVLKLSKNGERVLCVANADGGLYQTSSLAIIYEPEPKIHVEVEYTGNDLEKITDMKVLQNEKESYQPLVCSIKDGKIKIY